MAADEHADMPKREVKSPKLAEDAHRRLIKVSKLVMLLEELEPCFRCLAKWFKRATQRLQTRMSGGER